MRLKTPRADVAFQSQLANPSLFRTKGYINGQWVDALDGVSFPVTNPATGEKLGEMPNMPRSQVQEAIVSVQVAVPKRY